MLAQLNQTVRDSLHAGKLKAAVNFVSTYHGQSVDVEHFSAFVPLAVQEAMTRLPNRYDSPADEQDPSVILFADVSGFTKLSVVLSHEPHGAEKLAMSLNDFFAVVITEVERFGGDVTKFSGDAVTIRWRCKPGKNSVESNLSLLTLYATKCSLAAHAACKAYTDSCTGVGKELGLHCSVGAGQCTAVHIGGGNGRWEYVIYGDVLKQIAEGMDLSEQDMTVISQEAWGYLEPWHSQGLVRGMTLANDCMDVTSVNVNLAELPLPTECQYSKHVLSHKEVLLLARYIPGAVYRAIVDGNDALLHGEMREASAMFIKIAGISVSDVTNEMLCRLMELVQSCCYMNEGAVNKLLVDDKGLLVLVVFGLPPMAHMDDPARAVSTGRLICKAVDDWELPGSDGTMQAYARALVGVSSGRVYCGVTGAECESKAHGSRNAAAGSGKFYARQEYTVLGANVNMAARLMSKADPGRVCVCERTEEAARDQFVFEERPPTVLKGMNRGTHTTH
jgi:class 3 adenylate cyclase